MEDGEEELVKVEEAAVDDGRGGGELARLSLLAGEEGVDGDDEGAVGPRLSPLELVDGLRLGDELELLSGAMAAAVVEQVGERPLAKALVAHRVVPRRDDHASSGGLCQGPDGLDVGEWVRVLLLRGIEYRAVWHLPQGLDVRR